MTRYHHSRGSGVILVLLVISVSCFHGFLVPTRNHQGTKKHTETQRRFSPLLAASPIEDRQPLSRREMEQRAVSLTALLDAPTPNATIAPVHSSPISPTTASPNPQIPQQQKQPNAQQQKKRPQRISKPWTADYYTSVATQSKLKAVAQQSNAQRILSYLLSLPPNRCNAANLVCAMTLASKKVSSHDNLHSELTQLCDIWMHLLTERSDYTVSIRQLSNLAWSLAKFYTHGAIIPEDLMEAMAVALSASIRSSTNTIPTQELCMSCWAYGILRKRQRPTGWQETPTTDTMARTTREVYDGVELFGFGDEEEDDEDDEEFADDDMEHEEEPDSVDVLLDDIALALSDGRLSTMQWKELANVAWSFATIGRASSEAAQPLLNDIAQEATNRLSNDPSRGNVQSRDIAQLIWSLGVLQADNYRLEETFAAFVAAVSEQVAHGRLVQDVMHWSCADIVQTALSLAHARLDEQTLLLRLYQEATARVMSSTMNHAPSMQVDRKLFFEWELSVLLWVQARLYLTDQLNDVFQQFTLVTMRVLGSAIESGKSLTDLGIGPQERANIVWSLAVLECWQSPSTRTVIKAVFDEASMDIEDRNSIQLDHAHQLWQALAILEPQCPECFVDVPSWFRSYLDNEWKLEKARPKQSSARHRALSKTLDLMGVAHYNEHDEDIDVAIVLKPKATWTHETVRGEMPEGVKVAVEFDGPVHFTREDPEAGPPRTLGHTVLKYRLLKQAGWTVVRVPYFVFDRIPFWASMERQRFVQRLLKTHGNLRFSDVDVSEYKAHIPNRQSRFD